MSCAKDNPTDLHPANRLFVCLSVLLSEPMCGDGNDMAHPRLFPASVSHESVNQPTNQPTNQTGCYCCNLSLRPLSIFSKPSTLFEIKKLNSFLPPFFHHSLDSEQAHLNVVKGELKLGRSSRYAMLHHSYRLWGLISSDFIWSHLI